MESRTLLDNLTVQSLLDVTRENAELLCVLVKDGVKYDENLLNLVDNAKVLVEYGDKIGKFLLGLDHNIVCRSYNPLLHFPTKFSTHHFRDQVMTVKRLIDEEKRSQESNIDPSKSESPLSDLSSYWQRIGSLIENGMLIHSIRLLKSAFDFAQLRMEECTINSQTSNNDFHISHQCLNASSLPSPKVGSDILEKIHGRLENLPAINKQRIAVLQGPSEVGMKTTLALKYCEKFQKSNPNIPIFWVDATSTTTFEYNYCLLHQHMNIGSNGDHKDSARTLAKFPTLTNLLEVKRWLETDIATFLLVIDGLHDTNHFRRSASSQSTTFSFGFSEHGYSILDFLPTSPNGRFLFTTSKPKIASMIARDGGIIEVGLPRSLDDIDLGSLPVTLDKDDLGHRAWLERLQLCPHAITMSKCLVKQYYLPASMYAHELDTVITASTAEVFETLLDVEDPTSLYTQAIRPVALLDYAWMQQHSSIAVQILSHMACLEHSAVPIDFIMACIFRAPANSKFNMDDVRTVEEFKDALDLLVKCSLIYPNCQKTCYTLHRQIQRALRQELLRLDKLQNYVATTCLLMASRIDADTMAISDHCRSRLPYISHALELDRLRRRVCPDDASLGPTMLCSTLTYVYRAIQILRNEVYFRREWIRLEELQCGSECRHLLISKLDLVYKLVRSGLGDEAETICEDVLNTSKRVFGAKDRITLACRLVLAERYGEERANYSEAEISLRGLNEAIQQCCDEGDQLIRTAKQSLINVLESQRKFDEAEELQKSIIERDRAALTFEDEKANCTLQISIGKLVLILGQAGRTDEAEVYQREVVELNERYECDDYAYILKCRSNLAALWMEQGRYWEAENAALALLRERKRVLGVRHTGTVHTMANIAYIWHGQGKHKEAITMMLECLALGEDVMGSQNTKIQSWRASLETWATDLERTVEEDQPAVKCKY